MHRDMLDIKGKFYKRSVMKIRIHNYASFIEKEAKA